MSEKGRALTAALSQIERSYGKGAIMKLGEAAAQKNIDVIPTGSLTLDMALGVGGIPRGRVVEIYGPESSGKTTLALHVIAQAQKLGGVAAFIDAEHALDPVYAGHIGVKTEDLLISQPDTGEQALEIVDVLVRSGAVDVIVVDSVAALVPKAEIDGEMGDSHVALQARLMSQALRKLTGAISKSSTSVIFINQLREKVGIMFGNPEITTGGRALKFYASVRLDIRKVDSIKNGLDVTGNRVKVKVVKNKVAPPFSVAACPPAGEPGGRLRRGGQAAGPAAPVAGRAGAQAGTPGLRRRCGSGGARTGPSGRLPRRPGVRRLGRPPPVTGPRACHDRPGAAGEGDRRPGRRGSPGGR